MAILGYLSMYLTTFPKVYIDEPWESIPARQLWTEGKLNDPVLTGREYNEVHLLAPRLLQAVVLAPIYGICGIGLGTGRACSLLWAALALALFRRMLAANAIEGRFVWLGVGLLGTDNLFYIFARLIRPEIMMTLLGIAASHYLLRGLEEKRRSLMLASGLLAGLGGWCHPNFAFIIGSFALLLVFEYRQRVWRETGVRAFCTGVCLGLLPYLVYVVYQDGGNGFAHLWAQIQDRVPPGGAGYWTRSLTAELDRYRQYVFHPYRTPVTVVQVFYLALSGRLRGRLARLSRIVIGTHVALFPLLVVSRNARYLLPVVPFVVALIALAVQGAVAGRGDAREEPWRRMVWRRLAPGMALALLTYQLIGTPVMIATKRVGGYDRVVDDLRRVIPPGSRVWGSMMFWFAFVDCDYRTQYTFAADLHSFRPQYVITGDDVIWKKERYFRLERGKEWHQVVNSVNEYIQLRGQLVGELPDRGYGTLHVWKVDGTGPGREVPGVPRGALE